MSTEAHLLTLTQWLSPAYPVGAFAYSHGLERAIDRGVLRDADALASWLEDILAHGSGRNDALFLAAARRAAPEAVAEIDALARAFAASRERLMETDLQGAAFGDVTGALWGGEDRSGGDGDGIDGDGIDGDGGNGDRGNKGGDLAGLTYPVALGRAAAHQDIPLEPTLRLFLQSFAANLALAAVRLVPLGQTAGQRVIRDLAPVIETVATEAATGTLDDLGGACFAADIAAMQHETQYSRVFRT